MRRLPAVVLALVLPLGVSACGDPIENYCDTLKEHRKELNELVDAESEFGLITHQDTLREIAEDAPEDITDEWQTFLTAVEGLAEAVEESGHAPEDFADGKTPGDLEAEDRRAIKAAANRLTSRETVTASQGIDQQARDVCQVNLGR